MTDQSEPSQKRTEFLIEYYQVLWGNINRHIQGVWQTLTALGGSIALLALVKDDVISLSLAATMIVGLSAWYSATVYDSALWFARNQLIAENIEGLFLKDGDEKLIQPYFAEPPRSSPLISHFRIALWLSRGIVGAILLFHLQKVVCPLFVFQDSFSAFQAMPYLSMVLYLVVEYQSCKGVKRSYDELRENKCASV